MTGVRRGGPWSEEENRRQWGLQERAQWKGHSPAGQAWAQVCGLVGGHRLWGGSAERGCARQQVLRGEVQNRTRKEPELFYLEKIFKGNESNH